MTQDSASSNLGPASDLSNPSESSSTEKSSKDKSSKEKSSKANDSLVGKGKSKGKGKDEDDVKDDDKGESKGGRRIQVRKSGVHGKGVFSVAPLKKGEVLIEYKGEVITWKQALRRHPHDPKDPDHTFYFHIDDKHVIDAKFGGNAARWINHACTPNCEADEVDGRIFIKTLKAIKPGIELFYDYGLIIDEPYTAKLKKKFECRCGTKGCRGTMLAPKR